MENNLSRNFVGSATDVPEIPGQHRKSVVNAIILIDGLVPVFKRSKNGQSWYDLPGGKPDPIDPNDPNSRLETIFEAIERELWEELGIKATADHEVVVDAMPHPYIQGAMKTFVHCNYVSGLPYNKLPHEHDELLLVTPQQAIQLLGERISPFAAVALLEHPPAANEILPPVVQERHLSR